MESVAIEFSDIDHLSISFEFNSKRALSKIDNNLPDLIKDNAVYEKLTPIKEQVFRNIYNIMKEYEASADKSPYGYALLITLQSADKKED